MEKSRLYKTLDSFNSAELKELERFVASPIYNRQSRIVDLYKYLHFCLEKKKTPTKTKAFAALFPKKTTYSDQQLRLQISELYKLVENYLVFRERKEDVLHFPKDLVKAYRKQGLERQFNTALKKANAAIDSVSEQQAEYYQIQVELAFEEYRFQAEKRQTQEFRLQDLADLEDKTFCARKLRLLCIALAHQTVYKTDYSLGLIEPILTLVSEKNWISEPSIGLYFHCYHMLSDANDERHFSKFKKQLFEQGEELPILEQRSLFLLAINYCIGKINQSNSAYFAEALDLYKKALGKELLLENGLLSHFAYNNIAAIALRSGDVDWAEEFVRKYAGVLAGKDGETAYRLNLARIFYRRKNYNSALQQLDKIDQRDTLNYLVMKTLQIKICYEMDDLDSTDAHLAALDVYLRRKKVMGYHRTNYQNIVRYIRALLNHNPNDTSERKALRTRVESESVLTEKDWLLRYL